MSEPAHPVPSPAPGSAVAQGAAPATSASLAASAGFSNQVVVITGAARGIGEAVTLEFMRQGAHVVALDRAWERGSNLHDQLLAHQGLALDCDITDETQVQAAYEQTLERFGTVHVLINNAALRQRDFFPDTGACTVLGTQDAQWEQMFKVNVVGQLKVLRRFMQPMLAQRRGSVINVSANGSLTHPAGLRETEALAPGVHQGNHPGLRNQPYDATKAALTSLSFYLAEEVRASGVAVNVMFPGPTRTTGSDHMAAGRERLGLAFELLEPAHVLPLCLMLAAQARMGVAAAALQITGRAFDAVAWNRAQAVVQR
jgi:NAD(P)-dependent dehydrogenase (short-subunit alcohol dehydrogenase family)